MSTWFWLYDGTNTLDLGTNVQEFSSGQTTRNFTVQKYLGGSGGQLRGMGNVNSKTFVVGRKEKAESGDASYWNSRRTDYLQWFFKERNETVWLYIRDGEDSFTVRTRVYCTNLSGEKISYQKITDLQNITLISPSGVFENITATTGSESLTDNTEHSFSVTNSGILSVPAQWKYTPTANQTSFRVSIADNFGFKLEGVFAAGVQIVYDCYDGSMTVGGSSVNASQFLTAGSPFLLPNSSNTVYVQSSGAGTFAYEFNQRYI